MIGLTKIRFQMLQQTMEFFQRQLDALTQRVDIVADDRKEWLLQMREMRAHQEEQLTLLQRRFDAMEKHHNNLYQWVSTVATKYDLQDPGDMDPVFIPEDPDLAEKRQAQLDALLTDPVGAVGLNMDDLIYGDEPPLEPRPSESERPKDTSAEGA